MHVPSRLLPAFRPVLALVALAPSLAAQIVVVPRVAAVTSGRTLDFQARYGAGGEVSLPVRWSVRAEDGQAVGTMDPVTGRYTAPAVDSIRTVRVAADSGVRVEEAVVTVLPAAPFDLLDKVLGPGWLEPYCADMPFLDLETGRRFPCPGRVEDSPPMGAPQWLRTGCGQPLRLAWSPPSCVRAQLLSYREGGAVARRDVTGQSSDTLTPWAGLREVQVEALSGPCGHGAWLSRVQPFRVEVRGLLPLAGSSLAPGHEDGAGPSARFREPAGMAMMHGIGKLAVADPGDHALRLVGYDGRVTTLAGEPGRAGHRDRSGACSWDGWWGWLRGQRKPAALFRGPTHLAAAGPASGHFRDHDLIVADSGNHVLRGVTENGAVATLAGCPGLAGHRDADIPDDALFNDPRGVAVGEGGRVYVADRGNRVIRVVLPSGRVATVAGSPGQAGIRDGIGIKAQFTDLKALIYARGFPQGDRLLVLDGHAVRAVDPRTGLVTTLAGQVAEPGFLEVAGPGRDARGRALAAPCLRDPADLSWQSGQVVIADRGNHVIRCLDVAEKVLGALAGEPGQERVRYGLLRDGLAGPLPPAFAALAGPRGLACRPGVRGEDLVVATGSCLATLCDGASAADRWWVDLEAAGPAARNEAMVVRVRVVGVGHGVAYEDTPGRVTVEFREADGSLGAVAEAEAPIGTWIGLPGRFVQPGRGRLAVRYLSPAGVSAGARLVVEVR